MSIGKWLRDILEDQKSSGLPLREPHISQILIYYPAWREMPGNVLYVERNIEARSRNHCSRGKAISITYSMCMYFFKPFIDNMLH